jgi:Heparinase II/III-like protein
MDLPARRFQPPSFGPRQPFENRAYQLTRKRPRRGFATAGRDGCPHRVIINHLRKLRTLAGDPVLRKWVLWRMRHGAGPKTAPLNPHPPYLAGLAAQSTVRRTASAGHFAEARRGPPSAGIVLPLAGSTLAIEPGGEHSTFETSFADGEIEEALHRFAWIPLLGADLDPAWVTALWSAWRRRFAARPSYEPAWQAYTAAERVCNILDHARVHGLPAPLDDTARILADHGDIILSRLEYGGEGNTSNHLANNGRGLFRLGLAFGLPEFAAIGGRILLEEARRLFLPGGLLREGSSHYHFIVLRHFADAWLAARAHGRPETDALEAVVQRALAAAPGLVLPGGLPLIGDVSPDSPPEFLNGLIRADAAASGWTGLLGDDDRAALLALRETSTPVDLTGDQGWLRFQNQPWSGLWHVPLRGWPETPGHAHHDIGSFELHCDEERVFIDSGRRCYGESGVAAFGRSAQAHNTLLIDDQDPYPPNKPYYDDRFRAYIAGPAPEIGRHANGVEIRHSGYSRLRGIGAVRRRWTFDGAAMMIRDSVEGHGRRHIRRRLLTTLSVKADGTSALLTGKTAAYRLLAETPIEVRAATVWPAYGVDLPATCLDISVTATLPWSGQLSMTVVQ